jgi:NAD(P)H-dependent FMN reductase
LDGADAFVIISPEYNGMVPSRLKNFFLLASKTTLLSHKPAMLIGVSSGAGGAYPIAELRMSGYKNTKICYIPDHVIVRQVESVLNEQSPDSTNPHDQSIRERINHNLTILLEYAKALS